MLGEKAHPFSANFIDWVSALLITIIISQQEKLYPELTIKTEKGLKYVQS